MALAPEALPRPGSGWGRMSDLETYSHKLLPRALPVQAKHRTQRRWERCGPVWDPLSRGCGLAQAPSLCLPRPPPARPIPWHSEHPTATPSWLLLPRPKTSPISVCGPSAPTHTP